MDNLQGINWIDAVLLGIVIISALVGLARGLIREIFSFFAWAVSLFLALKFAQLIAQQYIIKFIDDNLLAYLTAFGLIFLISLFAIGLLNMLITSFVKATGLGGFDRLLGLLFGSVRGIVFSALLVLFGSVFSDLKNTEVWKNSKYVPGFLNLDAWIISKIDVDSIKNKILAKLHPELYGVIEQPDAGNILQPLSPLVPPIKKNGSSTLSLTSLEEKDEVDNANKREATRPEISVAQQQQQIQYSNALASDNTGNNADGIMLESMSDLTIDQNTDHIQPDSDEPNNNDMTNSPIDGGAMPDVPPLQLESTQENYAQ